MPMVAPAARPQGDSRFGAARRSADGSPSVHRGVDLYAPAGTPITSPGAGTVMHAQHGWSKGFSGYGRVVVVALDSGGEVLAAHLNSISVDVGERVKRGQQLGTVGDTLFSDDNPTGSFQSSKPHTHIEFLTGHSYPVPRETARQDPTALAFYDARAAELPPKPKPKPEPADAEVFATVEDAQQRADALLGRWNALVIQSGAAALGGRPEVPRYLAQAIVDDRARFKKFTTRPSFGLWGALVPRQLGPFVGSDYAALTRWYTIYAKRAAQVSNLLPPGEALAAGARPQALPRQRTATENLESVTGIAQGVLFVVAATGLLAAALAIASKVRR